MRLLTVASIGLATLASACSPGPEQYTVAEWRDAQTRSFPQPKDMVIEAAAEVMRLSDPDDVVITASKDGIRVQRSFFVYVVLNYAEGTFDWNISADEADGQTIAFAELSQESWSLLYQFDIPVNDPSAYRLLWQRMDYLLGNSTIWPTCESLGREDTTAEGAFCDLADDLRPDGPLQVSRAPGS